MRRATLGGRAPQPPQGNFYPRSPCGERPWQRGSRITYVEISIHALLAESDYAHPVGVRIAVIFLSTLSLRRATRWNSTERPVESHFYPRSPCGERLSSHLLHCLRNLLISIHALLAESDSIRSFVRYQGYEFLSTLSLRRATFGCGNILVMSEFLSTLSLRRATRIVKGFLFFRHISIHALLAESDLMQLFISPPPQIISIHALLAESDTSSVNVSASGSTFLSTLSLRRATVFSFFVLYHYIISIHALLAESDDKRCKAQVCNFLFLSTLSLRRATSALHNILELFPISIHALLAESDEQSSSYNAYMEEFLSTLSLRRATRNGQNIKRRHKFLSTLSLRRATADPGP